MDKNVKYAGFNLRMWASTIDTIIAYFTLNPLTDWLLRVSGNEQIANTSEIPDMSIQELANMQGDPNAINKLLEQSATTSGGWLHDWLLSSFLQSAALIIASAICWKLWSATPGKMVCKIKVVDADTLGKMSDDQIFKRALGYIPSCAALFIGMFWIGFDKRKQGWHDKMANTVVIKQLTKKEIEERDANEKLQKFVESTMEEPRRF